MEFLSDILIRLVAIAVAISVHEFGHAYSAYLLGDNTAKMYGRMTLDPAKHIDPVGLITLILFRFGWAKPVPVNPNNFKNYKVGNIIVSFAGAFFNIITAIICLLLIKNINFDAMNLGAVATILSATVQLNIGFAAFNLLPIPPLDGWGIVSMFIPYKWNEYVYQYESMSQFILLFLIVTGGYSYILSPIYNVITNIVFMFL